MIGFTAWVAGGLRQWAAPEEGGSFNLFLKADPVQCAREWGSAHPFTATRAQGLDGKPPFLDLDPPK